MDRKMPIRPNRGHTGGGNTRGTRASFGSIRVLPSGRVQARYTGPDMKVHRAPVTFTTKGEARAWLSLRQADITRDKWLPPSEQATTPTLTFEIWAERWLQHRDLKVRTVALYRSLLDRLVLPTFAGVPLRSVSPEAVRDWYAALDATRPTQRAHAYSLLRTIMAAALDDGLVLSQPCRIKGAGAARRVRHIEPLTVAELNDLVRHMPERYRLMTLLAAWAGLRYGELTELRSRDVDLKSGTVHIRRAVVRSGGKVIVGTPKSRAGIRTVALPPHLMGLVRAHIDDVAEPNHLLFPAAASPMRHMPGTPLRRAFYKAREAIGRPSLRWHDLRHSGAVLAAQAGATLPELMQRLGHSTASAAMVYQHAARGRDAEIARRLSALAAAGELEGETGALSTYDKNVDGAEGIL